MHVPEFSYRGVHLPAIEILYSPNGYIAEFGASKSAYELAPNSGPLLWRYHLFTIGMHTKGGVEDACLLPGQVRKASKKVYDDCYIKAICNPSGCWHNSAVRFYKPGEKPRGLWVPEGHVAARFYEGVRELKKIGDKWEIIDSSEAWNITLPNNGSYIVQSDPSTGLPLEVVASKAEVVKRLTDAGFELQLAERNASKFYINPKLDLAVVCSQSCYNDGPLCVGINFEPSYFDPTIGSFPVRRAAERSEAQKMPMSEAHGTPEARPQCDSGFNKSA